MRSPVQAVPWLSLLCNRARRAHPHGTAALGLCRASTSDSDAAEDAYSRQRWEAANSQVRSYLDALFEGTAQVHVGRSVTGGAARKALQNAGLVTDKQGEAIQKFMAYAGESGSHPGLSGLEDARARRLAGLGFASLGLALLPELIRVADVFAGL